MSTNINPLEEIGNKNPFKVPEDYFEGLSNRIMAQLPDSIGESPKKVSLWSRIQPWTSIAALFCGVALMVFFLNRPPQQSASNGLNLFSIADMEDFYEYYEEQVTNNIYNDAIYVDIE